MGIGCYTGWDLLSPKLTTLDFHYEKTAAMTAEWLDTPPPKTFKFWESEVIPGESTAMHSGKRKKTFNSIYPDRSESIRILGPTQLTMHRKLQTKHLNMLHKSQK